MASMDEFRKLLPEQAAKAKFYANDTVAEWQDEHVTFTVTLYPNDENCWDVFIVYDNGVQHTSSDISDSLPVALYRALRMTAFAVQMHLLQAQYEMQRLHILTDKLAEAAVGGIKP